MQLDINNFWVLFVSIHAENDKLLPEPLLPDQMKEFLDRWLLLDLETGRDRAVHKTGAVSRAERFLRQGRFQLKAALAEPADRLRRNFRREKLSWVIHHLRLGMVRV